MKDILIIAHFTQVPGEKGNGRFNYLANLLANEGMSVEVVTTQFSHRTKSVRNITQEQLDNLNYKLTMLKEPGYKTNVSLRRFYSHYIMGRSLKKYLSSRKKPDVIYCAVPSLDVGIHAMKYAKKNNIKFIIDIQDLWPEAFKMIFNIPLVSQVVFKPMEVLANRIYREADEVIAVSNTYVDRALRVNKKVHKGLSVFLGTDFSYFDKCAEENIVFKPKNELWLIYIGTLGHSYDIPLVLDALYELKRTGLDNIKFMILGDGPLKKSFEDYAEKLNVNTEFLGRLDYGKMIGYLKASDIAINPIRKGTAATIINKVGDYAAAGLPVINTQECNEYKSLVDTYYSGINCDANTVSNSLKVLSNNINLRNEMGRNSRILGEEMFDRRENYKHIVNLLKK